MMAGHRPGDQAGQGVGHRPPPAAQPRRGGQDDHHPGSHQRRPRRASTSSPAPIAAEFDQMGAWDDTPRATTTAMTSPRNGPRCVKRLWSEPSVTHAGRFFHHEGLRLRSQAAVAAPARPDLRRHVGAGLPLRRARGRRLLHRRPHAEDERRDASRRARALAAELGRSIKTYAMCTVIYADTDADAEALVARYREGVDMGAVIEMLRSWGVPPERLDDVGRAQGAFMTQTVVGSPATCARPDRRPSSTTANSTA